MIKISLNKELDYEVYNDFHNLSVAGADFGEKIKTDHPNLNLENYKKYIDDFYLANQSELEKKQEQINQLLNEKQSQFFSALKDLFNTDFSDDIYQGYLSIFNCNPRYPETKTFQIYYKKDLPHMLEVAFHESLHFAFFTFCDQLEECKSLDKNRGPLWELSEIFNVIVLNLPQFQAILKQPEQLFYPDLKEKLEKVRVIWLKNEGDLKKFIKESLTLWII